MRAPITPWTVVGSVSPAPDLPSLYLSGFPDKDAAIDQGADQLLGEEGIAAAPFDDAVKHLAGSRVGARKLRHHGRHVFSAELGKLELGVAGGFAP